MITFKQFLSEAEVSPMAPGKFIADEKLLDYLDMHCAKAMASLDAGGPVLYRGFSSNTNLTIIDTATGTRMSENTSNWYTQFLDTNPANAAWPKRSKSLICSTDKLTAQAFAGGGPDSLAIVLPFDGVQVAEVLSDDLWTAHITAAGVETTYPTMNEVWPRLFNTGNEMTFEAAKSALEQIDATALYERFNKNVWTFMSGHMSSSASDAIRDRLGDDPEEIRKFMLECLETFYDLSKQKDAFKLHDGMGNQDRNHECWFSGKAVIVPSSKWRLIR